jgi:hypothetical protein
MTESRFTPETKRRVRVPRYEFECANPWCQEPFKAFNSNALYHDAICRKVAEREREQALRAGREPFGRLNRDRPRVIVRRHTLRPKKRPLTPALL